ncbi:GntR family transcriptional regulator [Clostridium sp. WB02_MRS01]|uniref:GntR family transcriptional regulator n=1 Tax=Clostridium sp. WB02_MRS01 TaxID=2605777 RepID=UPI00257006CB|nr:GntR family transcriptional regulator [Clostridium sp. WB02_MRS01]
MKARENMELHPMIKPNLSSSVKNYLYKYIRSLDLGGNTKLPPENELSLNLGVSRVTVRRALDELEKEGIVLRIHGRGTFVNPEALNIQVNLMPGEEFSRLIESCGYKASFEVADVRKLKADAEIARILQLEDEEEIYEIEKIYLVDGHPAIISIDRFACSLAGDDLKREAVEGKSTFDILRKFGGCFIVRDKIRIETMNRREMEQETVYGRKMECDSVLVFHGINYNQDNRAVIYDTEFYDTKYIKFSLLRVKNVYED